MTHISRLPWHTLLNQDYGLLEVRGPDALTFLQSQLTNDLKSLPAHQAQLTGYCSAKGRLLATFLAWKEPHETTELVRLLLSRDLITPIQKRLSMFVLRAKVTLHDLSDAVQIIGAAETSPATAQPSDLPAEYSWQTTDMGTQIRLPAPAGMTRWLRVQPNAQSSIPNQSALGHIESANAWHWLDIQMGTPHIVLATQEKFIPQMVNFDAIGGVSFNKGCYPGQEVVARSHYLGKLKRRMTIAHCVTTAPLAVENLVGSDVFHAGEPCGIVVNAASQPLDDTTVSLALLVELPLEVTHHSEAANPTILLGPDGPPLTLQTLPYALPSK